MNPDPAIIPPKRFHPRGLAILHEDASILVVDKAAGLLTVSSASEREKTAYFLLNDYVRKGQAKARKRVFIVHRLDRETSGLLVFAKSEAAKASLQANWQDFSKTYLAVVEGRPKPAQGEIRSFLAENDAHQVYSTPRAADGKEARTAYKVLRSSARFSLLEIGLLTGRKNQIRVHMSEAGHPVAGDRRYGARQAGLKRLCLHSASLSFTHPESGEALRFEAPMPPYFGALVPAR